MQAKITKASDFDYEQLREVETLQDLLAVLSEFKHSVVLDIEDGVLQIEIYDGYRE